MRSSTDETSSSPISSPWSTDVQAHLQAAEDMRKSGDEFAALAHMIAAQSLAAWHGKDPDYSALPVCNVATGYFMLNQHALAQRWYDLVLSMEPAPDIAAIAYLNLAAIHAQADRPDQARHCKHQAYRIQRIFIEQPERPLRRLLLLCEGAGSGNVPLDTLLATGTNTRIKYVLDFADEREDQGLPEFDLVFNVIGEPDISPALQQRLLRFEAACAKPLLNRPASVAHTQRQQMPQRLNQVPDVVMPPCIRLNTPPGSIEALQDQLTQAGIVFPVLLRPWATHGGKDMLRCEDLASLWTEVRGLSGSYITAFHEFRSPDGYYRKYRMIFIDGEPYPYHLAISSHWMVHYFSADMLGHPWKIAEESRFLQHPRASLGERAMAAVSAIGRQLALDYAGIDFTVLEDGRVLVFEANATMLIHLERQDGPLQHKNPYVKNIVSAFERALQRHSPA